MNRNRWIRNTIFLMTALFLFAAPGIRAGASSINELQQQIAAHQKELENANNKVSNLQDEQSLIQELIDDLNAEIINTMTEISLKQDEIAAKETEIEEKQTQIEEKQADIQVTEQEYNEAKAREEKQKDDMLVRVRRIYETNSSSLLNLVLKGTGLGNLLNRLDYVEQLYTYDQNKLSDYQEARRLVRELWDRLEEEKEQLQQQKFQFETD